MAFNFAVKDEQKPIYFFALSDYPHKVQEEYKTAPQNFHRIRDSKPGEIIEEIKEPEQVKRFTSGPSVRIARVQGSKPFAELDRAAQAGYQTLAA
jgi:hypothetical protein